VRRYLPTRRAPRSPQPPESQAAARVAGSCPCRTRPATRVHSGDRAGEHRIRADVFS